MFADDSLVDRKIICQADAQALQQDLDSLQVWEKEWQMEFNTDKYEVTRITTKENLIIYPYQIHQTTLRSTDQAKYLGVTITPDLSWKCHIDSVTKKANSTMAFLRRNIRSSPPDAEAKAYKTYVRPIFEYATCFRLLHQQSSVRDYFIARLGHSTTKERQCMNHHALQDQAQPCGYNTRSTTPK